VKNREGFGRLNVGTSLGVLCLLGVGFSSIAGCATEDVNSDAIRTQGMFVDAVAVAPGDATTIVRVHVTVGGDDGTEVNLVPPDTLVAVVDEMSSTFEARGDGRYEVTLNGDGANEIEVRLERGADNDSAGVRGLMPEPFAMQLSTDASSGIARGLPIVAVWEPPGSAQTSIQWSVDGDCIWAESGTTPDDGTMTLNPESLQVRGTRAGEECEVLLTLDRVNFGNVDAIFVPGTAFQMIQRRAVRFISTPAAGEVEGSGYPDAG
jgi:hypothetical protein